MLDAREAVGEAVAVQVETIRGLAGVGVGREVDAQGADEVAVVLAVVGLDAPDQVPKRPHLGRTRQTFEHRFQIQEPSMRRDIFPSDHAQILQARRRCYRPENTRSHDPTYVPLSAEERGSLSFARNCYYNMTALQATGKVHKKICRDTLPALSIRKGCQGHTIAILKRKTRSV